MRFQRDFSEISARVLRQILLTPHCVFKLTHLMVYSRVPSSFKRSSLFGVVMLWATDFFPFRKKVSGVQMLLASRLLRGRVSMGPLKRKRSSFQLCRKNTSMVYSWTGERHHQIIKNTIVCIEAWKLVHQNTIHASILENNTSYND